MNTISPEKIHTLHKMLQQAEKVSIVTHMKPDGDAIGSSLGMYHTLKLYGKEAKIVTANPAPANLSFIIDGPWKENIIIHEYKPEESGLTIKESDLIICLDFNAFHRTDTLNDYLLESTARKVLIDHHLFPDVEKFDLIFSKTDISSASELLYQILMELPPVGGDASKLPFEAATALMTGMTTDTNNFMNSVYPSTLQMASSLLGAGVDRNMIIQRIYNSFKESRVRLQGYILKDLMKITPDGVAYIILTKEDIRNYNVEDGDTEGFVNIPLSIDKVKMSIFIKEDTDRVRVSIRSKTGTSANRCAREYFNGGGHENAAGGRLYIPENIAGIDAVAEYIERCTHIFMNEGNE